MNDLREYTVHWAKTYYCSGSVTVYALNRECAETHVQKNIGNYTGSMQYDPNEDYIEAEE